MILSKFAQQVLAIVQRKRGKAYGFAIRRELVESTGDDISIGAIYVMLGQLEGRRWVVSRKGEATPNKPKLYFKITPAGKRALREQSLKEVVDVEEAA